MPQSNRTPRTVAVIGGGITGLSAAYRLSSQGWVVRLYEQSGRLGGSIRTEIAGGWLIECGPNSLLEGEPALSELIRELGLESELVAGSSSAKKRFIVRRGMLQPLPMSPPALFTTRLFSVGMRLRIFGELLQKPRQRSEDVSLEQFIREHFGQEAVDYGLNPFVSGIYAGAPALLSAKYAFPKLWEIERQHGSIIKGMIASAKERKAAGLPKPRIVSFRKGLQTLADTLASHLPPGAIRFGARVERIERNERWNVRWNNGQAGQCDDVDAIVLALPAEALATIEIGSIGRHPLALLKDVAHPPVTSLFLGYRRNQIKHPLDGFGALIPAVERRNELGILFSSSLFPGRAPEGHVALTVMVGGMRQPELARLPAEKLLEIARKDLRELIGAEGDPVFQRMTSWPAAIPQYDLGHARFLEAIDACEKANPGLLIGGNARDGIAVPNCIVSGLRLAKALEQTSESR
ncbi:MAG: protoporphyrinogen oxidase [Opitutaceae bacterium]|jgi:oxygen-dependent protoporphyrinogen oxidase